MKLRRLTELGLDRFSNYLAQLRDDPKLSPPAWLLEDEESSSPAAEIEVAPQEFTNRLAAAKYLSELLATSNLAAIDQDVGLWSWLSLFYFDQVCPVKKNGARNCAVLASYIPNASNQRRIYRHLLLGPWLLVRQHADDPDRLRAILFNQLNVATPEVYRLFIENPTIANSKAAVAISSVLYFNTQTQCLKRGVGSKGSGGCRSLIRFLQQLDCTYDMSALTADCLIRMLPSEFRSFIPQQRNLDFSAS